MERETETTTVFEALARAIGQVRGAAAYICFLLAAGDEICAE